MNIQAIARTIFWSVCAALFYGYIGYPMLVWAVSRLRPRRVKKSAFEPFVTVLITAYNEEKDIRSKLENTLKINYPKEKLEILVASDGSTDCTDEFVKEFETRGVKLFRQEGRMGKTFTQNKAVEQASGEIILFSDATTMYEPNILREMLPNFADETIGCVAGKLVYVDDSKSSVGTGAKKYWNYETFLKQSESRACSLIGASGCLYAVRKSAYKPMYAEACSDFLICTVVYRQGLRSVYEPNAVCTEETNRQTDKELKMRVRVISQTFTDLWRNRDMLNPFKSGFYAVELISHKVLRYAVPLFLFGIFITSAILAFESLIFALVFLSQIIFYLAAFVGWRLEKSGRDSGILAIPLYFTLANLASVIAFYKFIKGENYANWEPIRESLKDDSFNKKRHFYEESLDDCDAIIERLDEIRIGKSIIKDTPKVTVVIPAYNIAPFVSQTLDSVFAQTFKNYEIILVNDGSPDTEEFEDALAPYLDKIIYVKQPNSGASLARNAAICLSRGEFIAFLDGDDLWFPGYLESQIAYLEKNRLDMVYCDAYLFGEPLYEGKKFSHESPSHGKVTPESLINTACNVITSGTVLKKTLLEKSNLFDKALKFMQDFDLWFRLAKLGAEIGYQREVLLKYRVRTDSLSGTNVERAARNIRAMSVIESKYELTKSEKAALDRQMAASVAEHELEQGKTALVQNDFAKAREHFITANKFYRKMKLAMIVWLLRLSPKLTLHLFKKLRPAEFSFISPQRS